MVNVVVELETHKAKRTRRANGEGSIVRRADGRYQFSQRLGRDEETGRLLRRVYLARTRAELVKKVADERARNGGGLPPPVDVTVDVLVSRYLADRKPGAPRRPKDDNRSEIALSTYESWERAYRQVKRHLAKRLDAFTPKDVAAIRTALKRERSPRSMQMIWQLMRLVFAEAIDREDYLRANPWALKSLRPPSYEPKKRRALQEDEVPRFVAAAAHDRYEALWLLGLFGGLRLGEGLGLTWDAVDFEAGTITVSQQLVESNGESILTRTKTQESARTVYAGPELLAALARRQQAARQERHYSRFLFVTTTGHHISRTNLRSRNFAAVCKAAGIHDFTIHGLRHTWSVTGAEANLPLSVLAQLGGWSSTRMLSDRYAQHKRERVHRATAIVIQREMTKKREKRTA